MSENSTITSAAASPAPPGLDLTEAVWQLRILVFGLGALLFILSAAFNLYVLKQNRNITALTHARLQQPKLLDAQVKRLTMIANDLGNYSAGRPELIGIFSRYGVELKSATNARSAQP